MGPLTYLSWLKGTISVMTCLFLATCFQPIYCLVAKLYPILFATHWTIAHEASLYMGFPRQEYWNGFPFPSPGDLPNPGIKSTLPAWHVDSLPLSHRLPNA